MDRLAIFLEDSSWVVFPTDFLSLTELTEIFLIFYFAQEITITQHNKSKLFSASFNRNFPTDCTD